MSEVGSKRHELHRSLRWLAIVLLLVSPASSRSTEAAAAGRFATLIELKGPIGPAMSRYVEQALLDARAEHSPVVILQMDTPGGLDTSMRDIISAILASPVPVVAYVAPGGARAASAGTYILYASHVAAMAPATNLGAATPISIGGEPSTAAGRHRRSIPAAISSRRVRRRSPPSTAGERKAVNDAVAYIRSLAQLRSRNAVWAESAVRGAASLSSSDALEEHVIDIVAKDVPDLLRQLQGRKVKAADLEMTLDTQGLAVKSVAPDWRTQCAADTDSSHHCLRAAVDRHLRPAARGIQPGCRAARRRRRAVAAARALRTATAGGELRRPRPHGLRDRPDRHGILHAGVRIARRRRTGGVRHRFHHIVR